MHKSSPPHGAHCASCWDPLMADNYVEYMPFPSMGSDGLPEPAQWISSRYCESCVRYLLRTQWQSYLDHLEKPTCRAELRRLVKDGPPINLRDKEGLPCPDNGEVMMLWFMSSDREESAMLKGAIVGEDRQRFWSDQKQHLGLMELEQEEPVTLAHKPLSAPYKGHRYGESNNFLEEHRRGSFEGIGKLVDSLTGGHHHTEEKHEHKEESKASHQLPLSMTAPPQHHHHHHSPPRHIHCLSCWEHLDETNFVEYRPFPGVGEEGEGAGGAEGVLPNWLPSLYCERCVRHLIDTQWEDYKKSLEAPICRADLRELVLRGPPINLRDDKGLPCPEHGEVMMLWYSSTNKEESAKLKDALVGEEREKFWEEQKSHLHLDLHDSLPSTVARPSHPPPNPLVRRKSFGESNNFLSEYLAEKKTFSASAAINAIKMLFISRHGHGAEGKEAGGHHRVEGKDSK